MLQPAIIHPDQTTKQPVVWMCQNPLCRPTGAFFEFESDEPKCPKCKSYGMPTVQKRVLIHFVYLDNKGPIPGQHCGVRLACDKRRDYLATFTNGEAASGDPGVCNCPGCLKIIASKKAKKQGRPVTAQNFTGVQS